MEVPSTGDDQSGVELPVRWPNHADAMTTTLRQDELALLDRAFCQAVAGLPQVSRVVAVHEGPEPQYVVTVEGDWVEHAPAIHRAVRPLRRFKGVAFHYRTVRKSWDEPDPTPSVVLYSRA